MKGTHVFNLHQQAMIHNTYDFSMVSKATIETIAAARIWRNLGRKAALGYTAKRGIDMCLVRLACQLEAMSKTGFVLGECIMFKTVCHVMAYTEKASPFASWTLINNKSFDDIIWS